MTEIWKPVIGYEDCYSVSDMGRIRRDKSGCGICKAGRIIKQLLGGRDRKRPQISIYKKGVKKITKVHNLVAFTFLGPRPKGKEINHRNGIPFDNRLSNLEYVTRSENMLHAYRINLKIGMKGSCNKASKLTERQVLEIRKKYIPKIYSSRKLAKEFNVHHKGILQIIHRQAWKHT